MGDKLDLKESVSKSAEAWGHVPREQMEIAKACIEAMRLIHLQMGELLRQADSIVPPITRQSESEAVDG